MCNMEQGTKTLHVAEIWRPIAGYEGLYEVSNLGRVRSLDRIQYNPVAATHKTFHPGHIMNGVVSHRGYRMVALRDINGKRKNCSVHRLVAMAFIQNPNNLPFVNHLNYDKLDNRVENLEWCTEFENVHYGRADRIRQANQPNNKPVLQYSLDGEFLCEYINITSAARVVNTTRANIRKCCNGIYKHAAGYKWTYK